VNWFLTKATELREKVGMLKSLLYLIPVRFRTKIDFQVLYFNTRSELKPFINRQSLNLGDYFVIN